LPAFASDQAVKVKGLCVGSVGCSNVTREIGVELKRQACACRKKGTNENEEKKGRQRRQVGEKAWREKEAGARPAAGSTGRRAYMSVGHLGHSCQRYTRVAVWVSASVYSAGGTAGCCWCRPRGVLCAIRRAVEL